MSLGFVYAARLFVFWRNGGAVQDGPLLLGLAGLLAWVLFH